MQKTEIHVKDRIDILEKSERYVILFDWCTLYRDCVFTVVGIVVVARERV